MRSDAKMAAERTLPLAFWVLRRQSRSFVGVGV